MRSLRFLSIAFLGLFFVVATMWIFSSLQGHRPSQAYRYICQMVYEKHYYGRGALANWYRQCLDAAHEISHDASSADVVASAKEQLAAIATSHLDIYTPVEDEVVWQGQEASDSGIRVWAIDGRFIVRRVYSESAADEAGVKRGDEIVSLESGEILTEEAIRLASGEVKVRRVSGDREDVFTVQIAPRPLKIDEAPRLRRVAADTGLLEISSFRKEYFQMKSWFEKADELQDYPSLIIDVRGNLGGDFIAVLRALSVFVCPNEHHLGDLVRPQFAGAVAEVSDNLSAEEFYDLLTNHQKLRLQTLTGYPCYTGAVTVLMDGDSASVSEIFARAMQSRSRTRVWGDNTRGDMLLGVWYSVGLLGRGYTLSIPEAIYVAPNGDVIEGAGVKPQRRLYYKLSEARRGEDSWVREALRAPY